MVEPETAETARIQKVKLVDRKCFILYTKSLQVSFPSFQVDPQQMQPMIIWPYQNSLKPSLFSSQNAPLSSIAKRLSVAKNILLLRWEIEMGSEPLLCHKLHLQGEVRHFVFCLPTKTVWQYQQQLQTTRISCQYSKLVSQLVTVVSTPPEYSQR